MCLHDWKLGYHVGYRHKGERLPEGEISGSDANNIQAATVMVAIRILRVGYIQSTKRRKGTSDSNQQQVVILAVAI